MQLFLEPGQDYTFLFELIISYLKLQQRNKINLIYLSKGALKAMSKGALKIETPSLISEGGEVVSDIESICQKLFSILPHLKTFFLGSSIQEQNEIKNVKSNLKQGKQFKKHLQKHLQLKTFFVSNHLTFADFLMFTKLYDTMIQSTDQQKNQYNNIFRWYRHIQNLPEIKQFLVKSSRLIITDPQIKVSFLVEKKKTKK